MVGVEQSSKRCTKFRLPSNATFCQMKEKNQDGMEMAMDYNSETDSASERDETQDEKPRYHAYIQSAQGHDLQYVQIRPKFQPNLDNLDNFKNLLKNEPNNEKLLNDELQKILPGMDYEKFDIEGCEHKNSYVTTTGVKVKLGSELEDVTKVDEHTIFLGFPRYYKEKNCARFVTLQSGADINAWIRNEIEEFSNDARNSETLWILLGS